MNYKLNKQVLNIAMLSKGYSISKLSKKSGVGKATISRILKEMTMSRPETIYKIAQALDIDVLDLVIEE